MAPGTKANFSVMRDKKVLDIAVTIGAHPDEEAVASATEAELGLHVANLTPELAKKLGADTEKGVVINDVDEGSLAAWAGVHKGTIVLEVNRTPVATVESFKTAIKAVPQGNPILFLVKQGDYTRYISLKVK